MLNILWPMIIIISIICSIFTGKISELSNSVFSGAMEAVNLALSILGMMCFWSGIMHVAEKSGITAKLAKIFNPIIKFIFPEYSSNHSITNAVCMNISANLLGLGNAATPFGIKAMQEMQKSNHEPKKATNGMIMFVIINTASLQLIPTMLCSLRQKHGSSNPMQILPYLWLTSIIALTAGVTMAKIFENKKD